VNEVADSISGLNNDRHVCDCNRGVVVTRSLQVKDCLGSNPGGCIVHIVKHFILRVIGRTDLFWFAARDSYS
jgi:hypothetical protein